MTTFLQNLQNRLQQLFGGKSATDSSTIKSGDRVQVRFGTLCMTAHPDDLTVTMESCSTVLPNVWVYDMDQGTLSLQIKSLNPLKQKDDDSSTTYYLAVKNNSVVLSTTNTDNSTRQFQWTSSTNTLKKTDTGQCLTATFNEVGSVITVTSSCSADDQKWVMIKAPKVSLWVYGILLAPILAVVIVLGLLAYFRNRERKMYQLAQMRASPEARALQRAAQIASIQPVPTTTL
jgi:hypothetical protein